MAQRSQESLLRITPVNLSVAELAEMEDLIEAGILPKDHIDRHFAAVSDSVFGADAPRDRKGNRIEQGLGSPLNQTQQSIDAYIKNQTERRVGGPESGFQENLERMRKELAATNERRITEREKAAKGRKRRFVIE